MLIGIHLMHKISRMMNKNDIDLYKEDGLIIIRSYNRQKTDQTRKVIIKTLKNIRLYINI